MTKTKKSQSGSFLFFIFWVHPLRGTLHFVRIKNQTFVRLFINKMGAYRDLNPDWEFHKLQC